MKTLKEELKELLQKHKATICFSVGDCSDTHGLYDEKLIISSNNETIEINGYSIEANDL